MNDTAWQTDVVMLRAGPVGLELAVALKQAGIHYLQVKVGHCGHSISLWPHGKRFYSSGMFSTKRTYGLFFCQPDDAV